MSVGIRLTFFEIVIPPKSDIEVYILQLQVKILMKVTIKSYNVSFGYDTSEI